MITTLNIGLAVEGHQDIDPQQVLTALRQVFPGQLNGYRVATSDTERTLVVRIEYTPGEDTSYEFCGRVYKLACMFGQDCIAVAFSGIPSGDLIGPGAKCWGKFSREFFIAY